MDVAEDHVPAPEAPSEIFKNAIDVAANSINGDDAANGINGDDAANGINGDDVEKKDEEKAEADGGYSSNSCNGGEDVADGEEDSQAQAENIKQDNDPFGDNETEEMNIDTNGSLSYQDDNTQTGSTNTICETGELVHKEHAENSSGTILTKDVPSLEENSDSECPMEAEEADLTEDETENNADADSVDDADAGADADADADADAEPTIDGEGANDTEDTDGSMSLKIGSVSSIHTVVHEDLSQWGAKLEADGENNDEESEEVWEDDLEKDLNEKETGDSDAEYDSAILKAMQESMAKESDEEGEVMGEEEKDSDGGAENEEDDFTLDGVPEVAETIGFEDEEVDEDEMGESNPLDDIDPYVDETEEGYDPLNDIGTDENTSGFLDQVNSGSLPVIVDLPKQARGPRGPYKKKKKMSLEDESDEDDGDDSDFDEYTPFDDELEAARPKVTKLANKDNNVFFKCIVCSFPFDTLGQMKVHKFADHEDEERPSFLDLAEAAIMVKKNRKSGVSKNLILQVNPSKNNLVKL